MMKFYLNIASLILILGFVNCNDEEEPTITPCSDSDWVTVTQSGSDVCYDRASVTYFGQNTTGATITLIFYKGVVIDDGNPFARAEFTIPFSGVELNTAYPLSAGTYFDSEDMESGDITFLTFNYSPTGNDDQCVAGTFNLTSKNPNSGNTTTFTNGRFFISGPTNRASCNPF